MRNPKSNILSAIREGLKNKTKLPYPEVRDDAGLFEISDQEEVDIEFSERFKQNGGKFFYAPTPDDLCDLLYLLCEKKRWNHIHCWDATFHDFLKDNLDFRHVRSGKLLDRADAGLMFCKFCIAQTGSLVFSSGQASGRTLPIYPPVQIVIAHPSQVVANFTEVVRRMTPIDHRASMLSIVSSASRTADIEKKLILGMHGPKELYLIFVDFNLNNFL
jgi:L-lactate dehydrogenase complex protein LldG